MDIRELDLMPYLEKVAHFTRKDAWQPDGKSLRFTNKQFADFRAAGAHGDVSTTPLLVGKPCFGILTAYLRHRDATRMVKDKGLVPSSRCARCRISEACKDLVRRRVDADEGLTREYKRWMVGDGPRSFAMKQRLNDKAQIAWDSLCRIAIERPFTNINDKALQDHYAKQDEEFLRKDAERNRLARKRNRQIGVLDSQHIQAIIAAGQDRHISLIVAQLAPDFPKILSKVPQRSLLELRDVWIGREILKAKKSKANSANIARWIVEMGHSNHCSGHAALCTRVSKDLNRIASFEALQWHGGPLIAPFVLGE